MGIFNLHKMKPRFCTATAKKVAKKKYLGNVLIR